MKTLRTSHFCGSLFVNLRFDSSIRGSLFVNSRFFVRVNAIFRERLPVLGGWFLATAFSQFLAAIIAQFTGIAGSGDGGVSALPVPQETVAIYGGVFFVIAISAAVSGVICLILSPLLKYWMDPSEE